MKPIKLILIICFYMISYGTLKATDETQSFYLFPTTQNIDDDNNKGHRLPTAPLLCTISATSGVTIAGVDSDDLYLYEIYTDCDILVASFSDAEAFIDYLATLTGVVQLRFHTADYIYTGYLEL